MDLTDAVLLGRQDFTVRSFDAVMGHEKWNVTYAEVKVRPFPQLAMTSSDTMLLPVDAVNAGMTARSAASWSFSLATYLQCCTHGPTATSTPRGHAAAVAALKSNGLKSNMCRITFASQTFCNCCMLMLHVHMSAPSQGMFGRQSQREESKAHGHCVFQIWWASQLDP